MIKDVYKTIKTTLRNTFFPYPPSLFQVELTGYCNLSCSMCSRKNGLKREQGHMQMPLLKYVIDESKKNNMPIHWFHHFGETLLFPHLEEGLAYFKQKGLGPGSISTNALLLDNTKSIILAKYAKQVLCCIDTMNPTAYQQIRCNDNFEAVRENIIKFIEIRDKLASECKITLQFLRTSFNASDEITQMMDYFGNINGVNFIEKGTVKHPRGNDVTVYKGANNYSNISTCPLIMSQLCVLWNGDCVPCCWDANGEQLIGNLHSTPLKSIWHGKLHKTLQNHLHNKNFSKIPLCQSCSGLGLSDEARVIEQFNIYADEWLRDNKKVAIAPYSPYVRELVNQSKLHTLNIKYIDCSPSKSSPALTSDEFIVLKDLDRADLDYILVFSPRCDDKTYFNVKSITPARVKICVIGGFLE